MIAAMLLNLSGTLIDLRPTARVEAEAEIVIENRMSNGPADNGHYGLTLGDLTADVEFIWDFGAEGEDAIRVTPPDGMICRPASCELIVPEGATDTLFLIPWSGM